MKNLEYTAATLLLLAPFAAAQEQAAAGEEPRFDSFATQLDQEVEAANQELAELIATIKQETLPLSKELNELQAELIDLRAEYQTTSRALAKRKLDVGKLEREIEKRESDTSNVSNTVGDFARSFRARMHVADEPRWAEIFETANLAPGDPNLTELEIIAAQVRTMETAFEQLEDSLGGTTFEGVAICEDGIIRKGRFTLVGPLGYYRSDDGLHVGTAEKQTNKVEPTLVSFADPIDADAAASVILNGAGTLPVDPTRGNAHKVAATNEPFLEHVKKGGEVMWPIGIMAGLALLVALFKWISLTLKRSPSKKRLAELYAAVAAHDEEAAQASVNRMPGPVGNMLRAGVEHLKMPRELIEELMYEKLLTSKLKLNSWLPFIAICAASAPLLGLLGTVTGIINTFKLLTVFGSGDVKSLSGGISEALITTKFGLIVAIPSLILHAFLSRKARGIVSKMETAGVGFINQLSKTPFETTLTPQLPVANGTATPRLPDRHEVRDQVRAALSDMLTPVVQEGIQQKQKAKQSS